MIDFKNIFKSYGGQELFKNAELRINKSERAGIVGPNGIGKSTLFRVITGEETLDSGDFNLPKNLRISYLKQNIDTEELNVSLISYTENAIPELARINNEMEEIEKKVSIEANDGIKEKLLIKYADLQHDFEILGGYQLKQRAEAALTGLGFSVNRFEMPMSQFSGGWQMRANLAKVLIADADILLLDEPSNYLDVPAIEWLQKYLRNFQGTLLLISHDRYLLNTLANVIVEVNGGQLTRYPGNYEDYVNKRRERQIQLEAAMLNQEKKKEQLEKFIDRFRYKATKSNQVQSRIKMLDKMDDITLQENLKFSGSLKLPEPPKCGHEIARLGKACFSYDKKNMIINDLDFSVENGDRVGVVGFNGMGKTTLLKILAGRLNLISGTLTIGNNVIVGYQAQEFNEILIPENSVYDTVASVAKDKLKVRNILGSFGFSGESVEKRCSVLSGGEKIRLLFASIFANPPNFLILDEPTTHLDIQARESLQNTLNNYKGTLIFVSHDIEFVKNVATTILSVTPEGTQKYYGNYDYYKEKVVSDAKGDLNVKVDSSSNSSQIDSRKDIRKQKAELRKQFAFSKKKLEDSIKSIEKKIDAKQNELNELAEALSLNVNIDFAVINKRIVQLNEEIEKLSTEWEKEAGELELIVNEQNKTLETVE